MYSTDMCSLKCDNMADDNNEEQAEEADSDEEQDT
jgi:hypothetical protein